MKAQVYLSWPDCRTVPLIIGLDETPQTILNIIRSSSEIHDYSILLCNGKLLDFGQTLQKQGVRDGDYITIQEFYTYSQQLIKKTYDILNNQGISLSKFTSKNDRFRSIIREALKLKDVAHSNFEATQGSEIMYQKYIQAQASNPNIIHDSVIPDVPLSISKEPLPMKFDSIPKLQKPANIKTKTFRTIDQATEYLQEVSKEWNW